jgi:hypothetical protein
VRRTRLVLLAAAVATAGLAGLATPANACTGPVCDAICELTVPVTRNCIVK